VNAGLAALGTPWLAVVNPDVRVPRGSFDRLADELASRDRAGLIAPHVVDGAGQPEANVGRFPTLARERAHTWFLDRIAGAQGRRGTFPAATAPVDWVSGCLWLMRRDAWHAAGSLDEGYFMYYEDVDYCRRLHDAGWQVLASPAVDVIHARGRGSAATGTVAADGGISLVRYFAKFHSGVSPRQVRSLLRTGWKLRLGWRRLRMALGDASSAEAARRYEIALAQLGENGSGKQSAT
jgi:GT2 family glycosyltransferase